MPDDSWEYVVDIHFNAIGSSRTRYIVFATINSGHALHDLKVMIFHNHWKNID